MKSTTASNLGLLIFRFSLALVFIIHGWLKLQNLESTGLFFSDLQIPWPHLMAYVAGLAQFGGGILLALGLLRKISTLLLIITMAVAVIATLFRGFVNGYEYALVLCLMLISLFFIGPGEWTFKKLFKDTTS